MLFGKGLNSMFRPTKCSLQSSVDFWCFYKLSGVYAFVPQHQNTPHTCTTCRTRVR